MAIANLLKRRFLWSVIALTLAVLAAIWLYPSSPPPARPSNYEIGMGEAFNQIDYYPLERAVDDRLYLPTGDWVGRLILPSQEEYKSRQTNHPRITDWAWIELYAAPPAWQQWVGKVVRLEWQDLLEGQRLLALVSSDIQLDSAALESARGGNVVPERLDGRTTVGPLQSLAGARPADDVIVALKAAEVQARDRGDPALQIRAFPLQVPDRFYGLVKILDRNCSGSTDCPADFFRVQHFNPQSRQFDGTIEIIRIPQQPPDRDGRLPSAPDQIERSPAGSSGWYIYGAQNAEGIFVVRAIQPRSLFQLQSDLAIQGKQAGFLYIFRQNWLNTEARKGTVQTAFIDPEGKGADRGETQWQEGDRALVIHLFGGIGGAKGDSTLAGTVTGHFAYGIARVVREPLADELQLSVDYEQVYAHNPNGIVAGTTSWANYMGDLQRGWLGTRPVSDVVVKLDAINQDYNFGGKRFSPLDELRLQLQVMAARYRTGDGSGVAIVTPSTSCVQDSNQALYIAIELLKQQFFSNPDIQYWLQEHPNDPQTLNFQTLIELERDLVAGLAPFGTVRPDWKHNAERLEGIGNGGGFIRNPELKAGLKSVGTMLPRTAHDELSSTLLEHGAKLWFLRTNQVGGAIPDILPVAPTIAFGQFPIVARVLRRAIAAVVIVPTAREWIATAGILTIYAAIALPVGLRTGFLRLGLTGEPIAKTVVGLFRLFFAPALVEELCFRVAMVPHPVERVSEWELVAWAIVSMVVYILYHPLMASSGYAKGKPTFFQPAFLGLVGMLGIACLVAYRITGSVWPAVAIHWIVMVVWLFCLGGASRLRPSEV